MKLDPGSGNLSLPENYGGNLIQSRGPRKALGVERGMKVELTLPGSVHCDRRLALLPFSLFLVQQAL